MWEPFFFLQILKLISSKEDIIFFFKEWSENIGKKDAF